MTVAASLLLAVGASVYTLWALDFLASPLRLLPQRARYVVLLNQYTQDFEELDDIIVAVEAPSPSRAKRYADRLVDVLRHEGLTSRITYRIDPRFFDGRGLLYLPSDDLARLRDRLFDYDELIASYAARPTLAGLVEDLNLQFANAMALGFLDLGLGDDGNTDLRFLTAVVGEIDGRLDDDAPYASPWGAGFTFGSLDDPDGDYFFSSDKRMLFVFVEEHVDESDFTNNRGRIETIRGAIRTLAPEFPEVRAGVTGGPTIADDEMGTALRDSTVATALAATLILVFLLLAYRRTGAPLLMLGALASSLLWALGLITLFVGHLTVFSIMFISLVIGIGIDYGIYFLYRYQEECARGAPIAQALERTARHTGPGMLLGALTAAGTFLVLVFTDFQGIREFGIVSAIAILMAFVSMLTFFPALLALERRWRRVRAPSSSPPLRGGAIEEWLARLRAYRWTTLIAAGALSAIGVWGIRGVTFDFNTLKLQAAGVESVIWEQRMLASAGHSGFTALATAQSLDELRRKQEAFTRLPSVSEVESVLRLVPDAQSEKVRLIHQFAPLVAAIRVAAPPAVLDGDALRAALLVLRRRLGLTLESIADPAGRTRVQRLYEGVDRTLARMEGMGPDALEGLRRLQGELYTDFKGKVERFQLSLDPHPVRDGEAPPELRGRYVGRSGRFLLRIHPGVDIWQEVGARRFIEDLRAVDPDVTGPPVTNFEATHLIERGYFEGTPYALLLVAAITFALLRSVRGTALALAPVGLGALWTLGVMRLLNLEFNLANVWALPLIVGTAAEYGLNIHVRYLEAVDRGGPRFPRSVVLGVVLSWLTTIAGFGSLLVAHHHGIFTLGLLLSVGSTASLLAAVLVLPVLIELFAEGALRREEALASPPAAGTR